MSAAPWVPLDAEAWPAIAAALSAAGRPWPAEAVAFDLRWWADQERSRWRVTRPGRPALCARWGWTEKAARRMLCDEDLWGSPFQDRAAEGPAKGQRGASRGPAKGQPGASEGPEISLKTTCSATAGASEGPAEGQDGASEGPAEGQRGAPREEDKTKTRTRTTSTPEPHILAGEPAAEPGPAAPAAPVCDSMSEPSAVEDGVMDVVPKVGDFGAPPPVSSTAAQKPRSGGHLRMDELAEDDPPRLPGLEGLPSVPAWALAARMPARRGSPAQLAGVVLRCVARVTGRPLPAPWGPDGGAMPGEGRTIDPAAETVPVPVLKLLRALRWPDLQAFEDHAAAVADATHRSPDPLFARHLRALDWPGGVDRSRAPKTIFAQDRWEERLDAALAWQARGAPVAALVPAPADGPPRSPQGGPGRPAGRRSLSMADVDALFAGETNPDEAFDAPRSSAWR